MSGPANAAEYYNWTWMKGSDSANQASVYGTISTENSANTPGGRAGAATWTDTNNNLWLFGGYHAHSTTGDTNDLWKFNLSSRNWTWMKGSNSVNQTGTYGTIATENSANTPGARHGAVTWTDGSGNLWMFGGQNTNTTTLRFNDLWKYNTATGNWTWMKGSSSSGQTGTYGTITVEDSANTPGARAAAMGWSDNDGNFWLFGGYDSNGSFNDLWKYNVSTGNWAWMKGNNDNSGLGNYGTILVEGSANTPGRRIAGVTWADSNGNLWLFGGRGYTASSFGLLSDLWKYNRSTGNWTWMKGSSGTSAYGEYFDTEENNRPGARHSAVSWIDPLGNLWLFGGYGMAYFGSGYLNGLWRYNISSGNWTFTKGSLMTGESSIYGSYRVEAVTNMPGGRDSSATWTDSSGNFWLFGGGKVGSSSYYYNDLWRLRTNTLPVELDYFMVE